MRRNISLYTFFLTLFVGIIILVLFGAVVKYQITTKNSKLGFLGEMAIEIAEFPFKVRAILLDKEQQEIINKFPTLDGFKENGRLPISVMNDDGFLLLSRYDDEIKQPKIELIQINNQKVVHDWSPNISALNDLNIKSEKYSHDYINPKNFRLKHPLLLNDGSIIFNTGSGLYSIDRCSNTNFFLDGTYHHSIEVDDNGDIWVPSVMYPQSLSNIQNFRDDSISKISENGNIIFEKSISEILIENGYQGLFAAGSDTDPIHLNDIQPALSTSQYWRKDDLLISIRNRSTVFLYRPSTNKIIWLKTGPWLNQHDVNFLNDNSISIFGNDVIFFGEEKSFFKENNNVYIYDFSLNETSTPFDKIMSNYNIETYSEGRGTPTPDNHFFIEETNNSRLLKINENSVEWQYVHKLKNDKLALLSWSRYLPKAKVDHILEKLKGSKCKK